MSVSTQYRKAGEGKIKFVKLGRKTLVDVASVDEFLDSLPCADIRTKPRRASQSEWRARDGNRRVGDAGLPAPQSYLGTRGE
jgi:excisionase family DNA binding protein